MKKIFLLCAIALYLAASSAYAAQITVSDDILADTYMAAGSSLNGTFNINSAVSALPNSGQYFLPYSISSAFFIFEFNDDLTDLTVGNSVTSVYKRYQKINNDEWYSRTITTWNFNEYEEVQLNIAGEISANGTDWYDMPLANVGGPTLDSETNNGTPNNPMWKYYYTQLRTGQNGFTGTVTLTESLGTSALTDLSLDGILPFTLTMLQGDMVYRSGLLTADLDPNPAAPPGSPGDSNLSHTPEPTTALLLGFGLLGLAGVGRKKS